MLEINITSNLEEAAADVDDLFRSQIPFGTSLAINATMKDIRRRIVGSTWKEAFTVRNSAFPGVLFRIEFSDKYNLEGVLYDQLGRDYVERHTTGGVKRPKTGGNLAIPVNVTRTGTGRIPTSKKPRALTAKKSTRIVRSKSGRNMIVERFKGKTVVRYVLAPSAKISSTFRFYQDAVSVFERVFQGHWNTSMMRSLRTSRTLSQYH